MTRPAPRFRSPTTTRPARPGLRLEALEQRDLPAAAPLAATALAAPKKVGPAVPVALVKAAPAKFAGEQNNAANVVNLYAGVRVQVIPPGKTPVALDPAGRTPPGGSPLTGRGAGLPTTGSRQQLFELLGPQVDTTISVDPSQGAGSAVETLMQDALQAVMASYEAARDRTGWARDDGEGGDDGLTWDKFVAGVKDFVSTIVGAAPEAVDPLETPVTAVSEAAKTGAGRAAGGVAGPIATALNGPKTVEKVTGDSRDLLNGFKAVFGLSGSVGGYGSLNGPPDPEEERPNPLDDSGPVNPQTAAAIAQFLAFAGRLPEGPRLSFGKHLISQPIPGKAGVSPDRTLVKLTQEQKQGLLQERVGNLINPADPAVTGVDLSGVKPGPKPGVSDPPGPKHGEPGGEGPGVGNPGGQGQRGPGGKPGGTG